MSWQSYNLVTYALAAIATLPIAAGELALGQSVTGEGRRLGDPLCRDLPEPACLHIL